MSASTPGARRRLSPIWLYSVFVAGWAFASVLVVTTVLSRMHTGTELTVAWFFVAATGVLIAALVDRDYRSRQESARLLEETQRVIDSVAVVTDPALAELGFADLLPHLLVRIRDVLGADATSVFLLEGDPPELVLAAAPGADHLVGQRVPAGTGVCWRAATSGAVQVVADVRSVPDAVPELETANRSLVAAPLVVDGNLIGVIEVGGIEPRDFGFYDLQLVHLVADRAAAAIDRGRLDEVARRSREGEERARRQLALLADAGEVLGVAAEAVDDLLVPLPALVVAAFADYCAVHLVRRADLSLLGDARSANAVRDGDVMPGDVGAAFAGLAEGVVHRGRPWIWSAGTSDARAGTEREADILASGITSLVVVPIDIGGLTLGTLTLATAGVSRPFGPDDLGTVDELSARVAVAAERVLLQRETREFAERESRRASQLNRLVGAAVAVNAVLPPEAVARLTVEQACRVLDADQASLELVPVGGEAVSVTTGEIPGALWGGEPHAASAALVGGYGTTVGQLTVRRVSGPFATEDEAILASLAQVASLALANGSLYETVSSNETRLRAVYDASPFAIVELDLAGAPVRWNQAAVELFDWPEGGGVVELPLEPTARAEQLVRDALGGGEVINVELTLLESDPQVVIEVASAALRDANNAIKGALLIGLDTSERRRVAEQLQQAQRMEAMGRLAGGVAHDFNNLLMVIGGYAGLLLRRVADDPEHAKEVEAIARAAERAAAITGQLLTISRHQVVAPEVVEVDVLLDEMRSVLGLAAGHSVEVSIEHQVGPDDRPRATLIDPAQLEQVLLNLVINARDAMPGGGTVVVGEGVRVDGGWVDGGGVDDGRRWVVLTVSDTGEGMDPRQVEHCFDPFFTTKPKTKGTGLGLSTAYGVITQAGGTIRVESRRGEGTTFTVELPEAVMAGPIPLAVGEVAVGMVAPSEAPIDGGPRSGRILLVEDEPDVRALTWDLLELEGYEVTAVPDAETALEVAATSPPDLLLTDVVMPGMNGIDLAAELARRLPDVRVLFVSGYAEDAPERRGQVIDAAYLLSKPASAANLITRVQRALDGRPWAEVGPAR
jgi:signal transduction histidine kinase/CheY-like chemotaxis protein/putative methionine-R-sulfoxide reductase with GAF domain